MKTVVSVTPVAVQADSRTFKEAASLARAGYRSVVVEGGRSTLDRDQLPFELISIGQRSTGGGSARNKAATGGAAPSVRAVPHETSEPRRGPVRRWLGRAPTPRTRAILAPLHILDWFRLFLRDNYAAPARAAPRADLYVLHSPIQFPGVRTLSRRWRAPVVYDAHDFYQGMTVPENTLAINRYVYEPFLRWLEKRCVRFASEMITVSDGVAQLCEEAFGRTPKVVRNVQDARLSRDPGVTVRGFLKLPASALLIVVVGQAKEGQALRQAIDAVHSLGAGVHLAFVGTGYDKAIPPLTPPGGSSRVHIVPPVPPNEVVPFIADADVSLIAYFPLALNYQHALPNGFFQSLAAGLAVLYPDLPEIRRIADQHDVGIRIDPRDSQSIVAALARLAEEPELLAGMKRRSAQAGARYSWEREETLFLDIVRDLIGQP